MFVCLIFVCITSGSVAAVVSHIQHNNCSSSFMELYQFMQMLLGYSLNCFWDLLSSWMSMMLCPTPKAFKDYSISSNYNPSLFWTWGFNLNGSARVSNLVILLSCLLSIILNVLVTRMMQYKVCLFLGCYTRSLLSCTSRSQTETPW